MSVALRTAGDVPKQRHGVFWRVLDRVLHPFARRRRTAAHRRVLHRQRHTGLVTGIPSERFELTDRNRRMLGLDPGPPGSPLPDMPPAEGLDVGIELEDEQEAADAVDDDALDRERHLEKPDSDPETQPMSAVGQLDEIGDAISLALNDLSERDDLRQ